MLLAHLTAVHAMVTTLFNALGKAAVVVEEHVAGSCGLENLGDEYYQFNRTIPANVTNSCETISLDLSGGWHILPRFSSGSPSRRNLHRAPSRRDVIQRQSRDGICRPGFPVPRKSTTPAPAPPSPDRSRRARCGAARPQHRPPACRPF